MITKETFNQYFKRKLIVCVGFGIVVTLFRLLGGHNISFVFAATILLFFIVTALVIGYIDYNFYEIATPKIISRLIDKEPLSSFRNIGFTIQEGNKFEGQINNYKIILSPLTNLQSDNILTILIPLQIREGLDNYFTKYNDNFRFILSGKVIFAESILKDYDKQFSFNELVKLIDQTTNSLRENKIDPVHIID